MILKLFFLYFLDLLISLLLDSPHILFLLLLSLSELVKGNVNSLSSLLVQMLVVLPQLRVVVLFKVNLSGVDVLVVAEPILDNENISDDDIIFVRNNDHAPVLVGLIILLLLNDLTNSYHEIIAHP